MPYDLTVHFVADDPYLDLSVPFGAEWPNCLLKCAAPALSAPLRCVLDRAAAGIPVFVTVSCGSYSAVKEIKLAEIL